MFDQNEDFKSADLEELFAGSMNLATPQNAVETLQSHMIVGFEEALHLGLPPMEALGQVLSWVASEMARIQIQPTSARA